MRHWNVPNHFLEKNFCKTSRKLSYVAKPERETTEKKKIQKKLQTEFLKINLCLVRG